MACLSCPRLNTNKLAVSLELAKIQIFISNFLNSTLSWPITRRRVANSAQENCLLSADVSKVEVKMQINNVLNTGVQGFQEATSRANQAAQEIASQNVTDSTKESINTNDLTNSLVDLKVAELDAKANAKVIQTATELVGSLLDITV